jgi:signal transduction histidine kinase
MDGLDAAAVAAMRPLPVSLADAINHEFRTPLASLLGHLEIVRDHGDLPLEVQFHLDAMERAGTRLSELVTTAADIAEFAEDPAEASVAFSSVSREASRAS